MELTTAEKIRILRNREGMTVSALATATGQSTQNLSNKLKRNDFPESELRRIASALGCELDITFTTPSGERI